MAVNNAIDSKGILTFAAGKTLTVNKTLTLDGTDGTTMTFPSTSSDIASEAYVDARTGNSFVANEVPSGAVNGINTAFDTANNYIAGSIEVFRDGQLMKGGGADYTETDANTITFTTAPASGSVLLVSYQQNIVTSDNADTLDGLHGSSYATLTGTEVLSNKTLVAPVLGAATATTINLVKLALVNSVNLVLGSADTAGNLGGASQKNVIIGDNAADGSRTNGDLSYNTIVGNDAGYKLHDGAYNVAIGAAALLSTEGGAPAGITGSKNIAIGGNALGENVSGSSNIALGYFAGHYETGSSAFYVDNRDRTNTAGDKAGALLYGTFDATPASQTLKVNGTLSAINQVFSGAGGTTAGQYGYDATNLAILIGDGTANQSIFTSAWKAWTPSYTNFTLGNGTNVGAYCQIGKLVVFHTSVTWGSSTSISGAPVLTFPVALNLTSMPNFPVIAMIRMVSAGTVYVGSTGTGGTLNVLNSAGTYLNQTQISATVPATWTTGDTWAIHGSYEAA